MKPILLKNPKSPISEAYRTLRTNVQFSSVDKNLKVILVTSSGPSEGKTTTAVNLALSFAELNKKTIVIDCDLRKPTVHKRFNLSNQKGLTNLFVEDITFEETVQRINDNLYVLTSGILPPNPAEMLSSSTFKSFIENLRQSFDVIILDTPPVIAVTDAQVLSTISDGVILVVSSGQADKEAAKRAKELLESVRANIIGVVLNKVEINSRNKYGYYYYYGEAEGKK